ncbi:MAG: 3-isopropylmalate dehydratase small subunit [Elusimicrobia bacterium RIFCSPLOWO2_02_FULL_39_32]|nr:MAG: 3-isopropylmalate dehydratase small subunit [Elusimicrobia bacterium RIFCSPHIGHO2_02_FULL_39_36]OGR91254.1 MAG: 3-isopropylmalate dehydratase small subunit [Elusimicrobia bacterium RIFCSPLOWO2_02_FULL_39_32]OGS00628.1 MAG: 3-isopropylmalate dehydratase small subunit [Elusimicrobia bacterium RIFCSPLOWO2_12_FULL_39_28]
MNPTEIKKISFVSGPGIPLKGNDLDTDRIIPARYLKCVTFDKLGEYLFYDVRFNENGSKKEHTLNEKKYEGATIMVVNRNFGCGSSREHAPQSLLRYGIKALIGESFAEIFSDNCTALGLPLVTAKKEDIENLMNFVEDDPVCEIKIDLEKLEVTYGDFSILVQQPAQMRKALIEGSWNSTGELLSSLKEIHLVKSKLPYLNKFNF